jgi:hypothetical protein
MGKFKLLISGSLAAAVLAIAAPSFAQFLNNYYTFGTPGYNGQDGFSGQSGRSGQDVVITANGQSETLNLQGEDGDPGSPGGEGSDAQNCHQGRPNNSLRGAEGGDGGDGGNGGYGGSGGDVLVYAANLSHLKSVYVDSTPGRGGYAGYGSRPGVGCKCWLRSWQGTTCHNENQTVTTCAPAGCKAGTQGCTCTSKTVVVPVCYTETFYCEDGADGRGGMSGGHGSDGSYGSIKVVNRTQPLEATAPSAALSVASVLSTTTELTRHEWDSLSGAANLFANGSRIRDNYEKYAGKTVKTVSFKWLDSVRGPNYYNGQSVALRLVGRPASVDVDFSSDILADFATDVSGDHTTVRVNKTLRYDELTKLRVEEIYGSETGLIMVLIDEANVSDVVRTHINIDSGWDLEGGGEYDADVPQDLIRSPSPGRIEVALGRLPGIKASKIKKYFGEKTEFEMEISREFVGTSARVLKGENNVFDIKKEVKKQKPIEVKMEKEN